MKPLVPLPGLEVDLGGSALSPELAAALGEVRVCQRLALPDQCELAFSGDLAETRLPEPGTALRVAVPGRPEPLFDGEVTAVELAYGGDGGVEARVRGYDLLHRLRKRQPVRAHVEVTALDLARELAADLGLAVEADEPGPLRRQIIQHRQSDLELLVEETAACGLYPTLDRGVLRLLTLAGRGEPLELGLGRSLLEARFEVNGEPCGRTVETAAWDPSRVERRGGRATASRVGRRVAAAAPPDRLGASGEHILSGETAASDRQAEALAQAELDRRQAAEVTLWGIAEGDPRLRPGRRVEVGGVAAPFAGRYVLTGAEHRVDAETGFVSEITTAPPPATRRPAAATAAWGTVTQVDDPEGLGRVKASLMTHGELESGWMGVVCPGAGAGKGLVALPDVGDRVLVLLVAGDPAQGVVVGGLYGPQEPPDTGVEGGAVRRYTLRTPGGQRLRLDDQRNIVRLENRRGSFVQLAPGKVRIHAATDLTLEAPGKRIVIRGDAIDFERA